MNPVLDISWLAQRHDINTIIDIGANDGAFGAYLAQLFAASVVHAVEPLEAHKEGLEARGFIVHPVALSDKTGDAPFHISDADAASSLLPLTPRCLSEYPQTRVCDETTVPTRRLDDAIGPLEGSLIKVDAQGAEGEIIAGGERTFRAASLVLIEVTFKPLYEDQALFNALHRDLDKLEFELIGFRSQHVSEKTGEPLFAHAIYENRSVATTVVA